MDFSILIQVIVAGLATGGVYGLIALGFVLIYKATSVLNLAMGDFMTLGAFICFSALTFIHVPFYIAFAITIVFAILLGIVIEPLILRPMIGEPIISVIMVTIGLGAILRGLMYMIWSPNYRAFPQIFPAFEPRFRRSSQALVYFVITSVLFLVIFKFFRTGSHAGHSQRPAGCSFHGGQCKESLCLILEFWRHRCCHWRNCDWQSQWH
jgi:branched-chain amino acid transport system permease protein